MKPTTKVADLQKTINAISKESDHQKVTLTLITKTDAYGSTLGEIPDLVIPFLKPVHLDYQRTATIVLTVPSSIWVSSNENRGECHRTS